MNRSDGDIRFRSRSTSGTSVMNDCPDHGSGNTAQAAQHDHDDDIERGREIVGVGCDCADLVGQ